MYDPISKRNIARYVLKAIGFRNGGKDVLDIGFGFGLITFMFERSNRIVGIELAETAVEQARRKARRLGYPNARFLWYPGYGRIPLPDNAFDLIICSHVLEHVPDDSFLLEEIKRMLKPNGVTFINVPINEEHFADPRHVRKYTVEAFSSQLKEHGFKIFYSLQTDRLWNTFGWFFEKRYHKRIPVLGFVISSLLNLSFSSLPFDAEKWFEERFLKHLKPRQFALCAMK